MGEARRRREAVAAGLPDPGVKRFKNSGGRRKVKEADALRIAMRSMTAKEKAQAEAAVIAQKGLEKARAQGKLPPVE